VYCRALSTALCESRGDRFWELCSAEHQVFGIFGRRAS